MIGSLLRVCSETYKQSNRNDNKTNNKDTQPRFEQDSTRSYSVRNDHSPSLIRSVHITHRFKKLYAKRKQAGRQALLDSCSASSERFGRLFQEHPFNVFSIRSMRDLTTESRWEDSLYLLTLKGNGIRASQEDDERLVVVSCPRTRGPVTHFG